MSYQVLARKYRPSNFKELEGQTHVLQALINALDNDRLHHAYLFTGTRGVGKTTIARILAKCLNCEQGVTSEPCNTCHACVEIAEGRSVDLIEVDAASRTGVDDMRDLLDNVQYMPTSSRFKVYLIDEVHMLSKSSFNAMLKTLEEPPAHVKFLFATTDPKKLPITVLSRCLQFNLKNMTPERVVNHLRTVLEKENIQADDAALWQLGRAAEGSMRDALSLTDQAIGFCDGALTEASVAAMLGTVDRQDVYRLLTALAEGDGAQLLHAIEQAAEYATNFEGLLDELLAVLHRIAVIQAVPESLDNQLGDEEAMRMLTERFTPEYVQLLYQIGLVGKRDLPLSPSPQMGFEMTLLRMLAFEFDEGPEGSSAPVPTSREPEQPTTAPASGSPLSELKASLSPGAHKPAVAAGSSRVDGPSISKSSKPIETDAVQAAEPESKLVTAPRSIQVSSSHAVAAAVSPQEDREKTASAEAKLAEDAVPVPGDSSSSHADQSLESLQSGEIQTQTASRDAAKLEKRQGLYVVPGGRLAQDFDLEDAPANQSEMMDPAPATNSDDSPVARSKARGPATADPFGEGFAPSDVAWFEQLSQLSLGGVAQALASHLHWLNRDASCIQFKMDPEYASLMGDQQIARLEAALSEVESKPLKIEISVGEVDGASPAQIAAHRKARALANAKADLERDQRVQALVTNFGATIVEGSVRPKVNEGDR